MPTERDRKPNLDKVFGDVLPDTTADERDHDPNPPETRDDDWYERNRPPHHDR